MGKFLVAENIFPPKYVSELGSVMTMPHLVHKVFLSRNPHDNDTRRVLHFKRDTGGKFKAELARDQKKYVFEVTPIRTATLLECGNAIVYAVQEYDPSLLMENIELFAMTAHTFTPDEKISVSSSEENKMDLSMLNEKDVPVNHVDNAEHGNVSQPPDLHTSKLLRVPDTIWNARTLAIYHVMLELVTGENDPSECVFIDNFHGKIRALTAKMEKYFTVIAGHITNALKPLKEYNVVEKEMVMGSFTGWWIIRFVQDVPLFNESSKELWASRNGKQGKPLIPISPTDPDGSSSQPTPLSSNDNQNEVSQVYNTEESKFSIPSEPETQKYLFDQLKLSLQANAKAEMEHTYAAIAAFCTESIQAINQLLKKNTEFLTTENSLLAKDINNSLKQLLRKVIAKR